MYPRSVLTFPGQAVLRAASAIVLALAASFTLSACQPDSKFTRPSGQALRGGERDGSGSFPEKASTSGNAIGSGASIAPPKPIVQAPLSAGPMLAMTRVATAAAGSQVAEPGLEVVWWVTDADHQALAASIGPYLGPAEGVSEPLRLAWQAQGLRLAAVPIDRLATMASRLREIGTTQRQWLGQPLRWSELYRSAEQDQFLILSDKQNLALGEGAMRLLLRSWLVPGVGAVGPQSRAQSDAVPAAMHIELIPQHQEAAIAAARRGQSLLAPPSLAAEDDGLMFTSLTLAIEAPRGVGYVLVGERPGVDWSEDSITPPAPERRAGSDSDRATLPDRPRPVAGAMSLGEHLLMGPVPQAAKPSAESSVQTQSKADAPQAKKPPEPPPRRRIVIVLIPTVPDRFTLTGR